MFPNVRLMIVAMFASIVAIGCGMGMFAAFRVNHEPLARLHSGNPPLQLVFGNGAPAPVTDAATVPFGGRFQLNAPAAKPVTMLAPSDPALPTAPETEARSSSDAAAMTPTAADADTGQETNQQASQEASPATEQDTKKDVAIDVALQSPADQAPPAGPAGHDVDPARDSTTSTDAEASAKTVAKTTPQTTTQIERKPAHRRVVKLRRPRQLQAATAAQPSTLNFTFAPSYASAPQAAAQTSPAPQVAKRRVAVKRHRPTKQTVAKEAADRPLSAVQATSEIAPGLTKAAATRF